MNDAATVRAGFAPRWRVVDWTLTEVKLGQARLHRNGRDADPILVLTASVLEHYGLRLP
ncbi:hypothetical protein [Streptomyces sp. SYP-A7185]|uniref:hypothetical protein n=1 Tax=Streptomyces sp. SYP-A7185 TaxID=3040076 RepID=UPI0038F7C2CD